MRADPLQLTLAVPLQPREEIHARSIRTHETRDLGRARIAILLRPYRPAPEARILREKMFVQGVIGTESFERFAAITLPPQEAAYFLAPGVGARDELCVEQLQNLHLGRRHAHVVDQLIRAQRAQTRLKLAARYALACFRVFLKTWNRLDIQIHRIEEQAARWTVRTAVRGIARKQGMQRIDADHARAALCADVQRILQVGEVADAPVALAAHGIKLQSQAPDASGAVQRSRTITMAGCDNESHRRVSLRSFECEAVIAERKPLPPGESVCVITAIANNTLLDWLEIRRAQLTVEDLAAFQREGPSVHLMFVPSRNMERDVVRRSGVVDDQHRAQAIDQVAVAQCVQRLLRLIDVDPHRLEQGFARAIRSRMTGAPDVDVFRVDAGQLGQRAQCSFVARWPVMVCESVAFQLQSNSKSKS